MLTTDDVALLRETHLAIVATIGDGEALHQTPVWIDTDGDAVVFNTTTDRVKHRNLLRNPEVSVTVLDRTNDFRWLTVRGTAELVEDGADDHIDRLAHKYLGEDRYPWRQPGEQRVIVRVVPSHRIGMG